MASTVSSSSVELCTLDPEIGTASGAPWRSSVPTPRRLLRGVFHHGPLVIQDAGSAPRRWLVSDGAVPVWSLVTRYGADGAG